MEFTVEKESCENMGALSKNLEDCLPDKPYYITTAISYTNGAPHMGHAYEFLTADVLARYFRVLGHDTYFVTGTDEHGQKVAASAEKMGRDPLAHCDDYVRQFKALHNQLRVTYDGFVRTTDAEHESTAQKLWQLCHAKGDIYLSAYEGWYNEREEMFVSDADAEAAGFLDPGNGLPLKRVTEESYFFRMSNFTEKLLAHIEKNPSFIEPEQHRNSILARLRKDGLRDLSISRTSFTWGIPVPEGFDQKHVMYVWFDALSNYLTGVEALADSESPISKYWPAQTHLIGKDIVWFHCVIWPTMLMSSGIPLPKTVFCHGFVNGEDGRKMSKSFGNSVDPSDLISKYQVDSIRYYMCAAATYGADMNFSEDSLIAMHNSELADVLGNLVHRVMNLCQKYCGGILPDTAHDEQFGLPFDLKALKEAIAVDMKNNLINVALFKGMEAARQTNKYLTEAEPWKMKGENEHRRVGVVRTVLEAVYAFTHFLAPVIPIAAQDIFNKLHTPPKSVHNLKDDFYNLEPGTSVTIGDILFKKIESEEEKTIVSTAAPAAKGKGAGGGKGGGKKGAPVADVEDHDIDFTKIEIRVGCIKRVWNHETAERLFCEEIDCGELGNIDGQPRKICSGLRQHYELEDLHERKVLVVCNLKESKFQGFMSFGMVLAAKSSDGSKVELVEPPAGSNVGDRIVPLGPHSVGTPYAPNKMKKMKVWEGCAPSLKANSSGVVCWKEMPLRAIPTGTPASAKVHDALTNSDDGTKLDCTVKSLVDVPVS